MMAANNASGVTVRKLILI